MNKPKLNVPLALSSETVSCSWSSVGQEPRVRWSHPENGKDVRPFDILIRDGNNRGFGLEPEPLTGANILGRRVVFLAGEASSGLNDCMSWLGDNVATLRNEQSAPGPGRSPLLSTWVRIHAESLDPRTFTWEDVSDPARAEQRENARGADHTRIQVTAGPLLGAFLRAKVTAVTQLLDLHEGIPDGERIHVLLRVSRRLSANETLDFQALGLGLRQYLEKVGDKDARIHFVIVAPSLGPWIQTILASGIDSVQTLARVVTFGMREVELIADWWREQARWVIADADEIVRFTGGQPLLVNLLMEKIAAGASFKRAVQQLQEQPPPIVSEVWMPELVGLLKNHAIRKHFYRYVAGHSCLRGEILPQEDREIYVAGWLGWNPDGRWTVRSELHKEWAFRVYEEQSWRY